MAQQQVRQILFQFYVLIFSTCTCTYGAPTPPLPSHTHTQGVKGFCMGLGVGTVGLVAIPLSGVTVGATQIVRGLWNTPECIVQASRGRKWDPDRYDHVFFKTFVRTHVHIWSLLGRRIRGHTQKTRGTKKRRVWIETNGGDLMIDPDYVSPEVAAERARAMRNNKQKNLFGMDLQGMFRGEEEGEDFYELLGA